MIRAANTLEGIQVLDLGLGMSAALVSKFLQELGARVTRIEPESGDPFYQVYPAYSLWRTHAQIERCEKALATRISELAATSDICILGGEDYPGIDWQFDAEKLRDGNSRLIVCELKATPTIAGEAPLPANDLLAQARAGFSYQHYSDRPIAFGFKAPTYGAALNAVTGVLVALIRREETGVGETVSTSLVEGALDACRSQWYQSESQDMRFLAQVPKDTRMTIFKCKDGRYVHMMMGTAGAKARFYDLLDIDPADITDTLNDRGMPTGRGDPSVFWGDIDAFAKRIEKWTSDEFIEMLREIDLPCVQVLEPGECWGLAQVAHNGTLKTHSDGTQYVGSPIEQASS